MDNEKVSSEFEALHVEIQQIVMTRMENIAKALEALPSFFTPRQCAEVLRQSMANLLEDRNIEGPRT